jgi:hypothetical protein
MPIQIALGALRSRAVRSAVTAGGVRVLNNALLGEEQQHEGQTIQRWVNGSLRFVTNWLVKPLFNLVTGFIRWSWEALWSGIIAATQFLYNFNWNISDAELDRQIEQTWNQLAGTAGGTLGNAVGWLACGVLPGTIIFTFNEPLGAYILKNVGEEALEELASNLSNLTRLTFAAASKHAFAYLFKKIRRRIRGEVPEDAKPWSFANQVEEAVESIPNEAMKNFTEEFLEEAAEACIEAGYVVANSLDSWTASQRMSREALMGEQRVIEIEFERDKE